MSPIAHPGPGDRRTVTTPDGALVVGRPGGSVDPTAVARLLGSADLWPSELTVAVDSLEQVFLSLTEREHLTATQHNHTALEVAS